MEKEFEKFLQDYFIEINEYGGIPITKDNCEDLFENWLSSLDGDDWIEKANLYGQKKYLQGKEEILKS